MFCTFAHSSLIIWYMLYYIKKYPVSLFIILTVIYLSFFKPPSTEISKIPNIDKVVHICMYFGMSGMLWLEFLRAQRRDTAPLWHAWAGGGARAGGAAARDGMHGQGRLSVPFCSAEWWSCCKNTARHTAAETGWILRSIPRERCLHQWSAILF